MKIFSLKNRYRASSVFALSLAFLLVSGSAVYAALTLSATNILSDGNMSLSVVSGGTVTVDGGANGGRIVLSPTFVGAGSKQSVEADATLSLFTGGYGAGTMGNVMGTVAAGDSIVGGLIGKYNVDTNPSDHPAGAVIGEIGEDSGSTADAAFIAVRGGDDAQPTAGAAYAVRNLNSTNGNGFGYGLDLFSAAIDSYAAVSYSTADIRLSSGGTVRTGAAVPTACVAGSLFIDSDATVAGAILFVCDPDEDGDGEFDAVTVTD